MPVNGVVDGMKIPEFDRIVYLAIEELNIKYKDYGNSWLNEPNGYWLKRMTNELDEFEKSMTAESAKRKLLNIINMAAMCYETYKMPEKCSKCGK